MCAKVFVHTFAIVVANNVLINAFDLRRRDVDDATAFAYFCKKQQNYVDFTASTKSLDATFYHSKDKKSFTRLIVVAQSEVASTCERCAAKRGSKHESYCDAAQTVTTASQSDAKQKTAFDLLSSLKKTTAATTAQKATTTTTAKQSDAKKAAAKQKATAAASQKAAAATQSDDDDDDDDSDSDDDDN